MFSRTSLSSSTSTLTTFTTLATRSTATAVTPLDINHSLITADNTASKDNIHSAFVFIHGLYGNANNFRSLSKQIVRTCAAQDLPFDAAYLLDMRNHGASPHSDHMTYPHMAADVHSFLHHRPHLRNVILVGHSMGGKIVMHAALQPSAAHPLPDNIALAVVDIAPRSYDMLEHAGYIDGMLAVDQHRGKVFSSRKDLDALFQQHVTENTMVKQFLMTNLITDRADDSHGKGAVVFRGFRINLAALKDSLDHLSGWHLDSQNTHPFSGPTTFLAGSHSNYLVPDRDWPRIQALFPAAPPLHALDAGHWVHSEKPREFTQLMVDFAARVTRTL